MSTLKDALVDALSEADERSGHWLNETPQAIIDAILSDPRMAAIAEVVEAAEAWRRSCDYDEHVGGMCPACSQSALRAAVDKMHALQREAKT